MPGYSVERKQQQGVDIYQLRGSEGIAEIVPEWGNNCYLFHWRGLPVLETVDFAAFSEKPTSYGIPILFPYPNRIRDGKFQFEGEAFQLNPPRHGFVRDKPWKVEETGSEAGRAWIRCSFDASDYPEGILDQFPFPFRVEVTYALGEGLLEMKTRAINSGSSRMPLGLGTHAYFRRPRRGTAQVPAHRMWELADSLPTGRTLPVAESYDLRSPADVSSLELDDIYTDLDSNADGIVRCLLRDDENQMETSVEFTRQDFPEVVVYTAPPPREAICIEPYTCPTDAFNLANQGIDAHLIRLAAGREIGWTMAIRVAAV